MAEVIVPVRDNRAAVHCVGRLILVVYVSMHLTHSLNSPPFHRSTLPSLHSCPHIAASATDAVARHGCAGRGRACAARVGRHNGRLCGAPPRGLLPCMRACIIASRLAFLFSSACINQGAASARFSPHTRALAKKQKKPNSSSWPTVGLIATHCVLLIVRWLDLGVLFNALLLTCSPAAQSYRAF